MPTVLYSTALYCRANHQTLTQPTKCSYAAVYSNSDYQRIVKLAVTPRLLRDTSATSRLHQATTPAVYHRRYTPTFGYVLFTHNTPVRPLARLPVSVLVEREKPSDHVNPATVLLVREYDTVAVRKR